VRIEGSAGATRADLPIVSADNDIFSRYTVGWLLADRESAELAEQLLADTIAKHGMDRDQLTIHADRSTPMTSKTVAQLLADLAVSKSHSRPRCSNT
jgi:putative transposase